MMPMPFISSAPRPQITPSFTSPANGSSSQPSRSTGTTSVWLQRISGRSEPSPFSTARMFSRPSNFASDAS